MERPRSRHPCDRRDQPPSRAATLLPAARDARRIVERNGRCDQSRRFLPSGVKTSLLGARATFLVEAARSFRQGLNPEAILMTKIEEFLSQWHDAREGLIKEVERIPEDKLDFRPAAETRSALELLYHVIESERMLVDEICRDDTDLRRLFNGTPNTEVRVVATKDAMVALLRSSLAASHEKIRRFGAEKIEQLTSGFDGKQITKAAMLQFTLAHEDRKS